MRNFTIHDMPQRSPEWYAIRCGRVTGSCAQAIVQQRKRGSGELAIRANLRSRLVVERLTEQAVEDSANTADMQRGCEMEPAAIAAYEAETGSLVQRVGFVSHNAYPAGCSPDGYVGDWEGVVEIKCPKSTTHFDYLKAGEVPEEYRGQVLHALWVTGAEWVDFCSFDPRYKPEHLRLLIVRTWRKSVDLVAYELALSLFCSEVDAEYQQVCSMKGVAA